MRGSIGDALFARFTLDWSQALGELENFNVGRDPGPTTIAPADKEDPTKIFHDPSESWQ